MFEGEQYLLIDDNIIKNNYLGIVLCNSMGHIKNNEICENYVCGILTEKGTTALIFRNLIT